MGLMVEREEKRKKKEYSRNPETWNKEGKTSETRRRPNHR